MSKGKVIRERFNKEVWAFKSDFTGSLAKWLVRQSPYVVPDNLSICVEKFHEQLDYLATFDTAGMAKVELATLAEKVNDILEQIPEIMSLNKPKVSRSHGESLNPDNNFIDIMAVAQNITCDFADRSDAQAWLDQQNTI